MEIAKKCKISKSSAHCILERASGRGRLAGKREKVGRPRKVNSRSLPLLKRHMLKLRTQDSNLTVKQLVKASGLSFTSASLQTYSRCLNDMGFRFLQALKKGLLREKDRTCRLNYMHGKCCRTNDSGRRGEGGKGRSSKQFWPRLQIVLQIETPINQYGGGEGTLWTIKIADLQGVPLNL